MCFWVKMTNWFLLLLLLSFLFLLHFYVYGKMETTCAASSCSLITVTRELAFTKLGTTGGLSWPNARPASHWLDLYDHMWLRSRGSHLAEQRSAAFWAVWLCRVSGKATRHHVSPVLRVSCDAIPVRTVFFTFFLFFFMSLLFYLIPPSNSQLKLLFVADLMVNMCVAYNAINMRIWSNINFLSGKKKHKKHFNP